MADEEADALPGQVNLSAPFIARPVATTLLTIGLALAGAAAFRLLPVSPLPQVDFPTISVSASLPGASPETMAATVATPLERSLGRIADITEMTSSSSLGSTRVTLQFDLSRDIDGAARDVQAALNAARSLLPTGLPGNPTYRKVNPADAPIMILALTSDTMTQGQMYDAGSTIIAQKLSQLSGVGDVTVGGSSLPAVRVELDPQKLNKYGIGFETVRTVLAATNANRPKGSVEDGDRHWQVQANDQAKKAVDYLPLIIAYRNGAAVKLTDLGRVVDSVQDLRNAGSSNGKPSVLIVISRQPNANIIETVDSVTEMLPQIRASIPSAIKVDVVMERTTTIRASLRDVERTLIVAVCLVVLVVFVFLRNWRATLIPSVAVPVSLIATFGVMYLCGFSLNNLSLMALTIATGFVVDDAIVVLENVSRHIEQGVAPFKAALIGAREVGFTVLSMSLSLIAVFIPILLMGGIVGRYFREFAVTLSVAILISLMLSLTMTPMMCSRLLRPDSERRHGKVYEWSERGFERVRRSYERTLDWALGHGILMMLILLAVVCLNVYLYVIIPKGFFPTQDTGRLIGFIQADQSISFQAMQPKLASFVDIVRADPAVDTVVAFTGGAQRNTGRMFVQLKPLAQRKESADKIIARLRIKLAKEPGANLFLNPVQDIRVGGRQANATYQYTLQADDLNELRTWEPRIRAALSRLPQLVDVNTDQQDKGLQTSLVIDRDTAARLGVSPSLIDTTLNDAFGQRQVSTIYSALNQYHVVMEASPEYWQAPDTLNDVYVSTNSGAQVPLSSIARYAPTNTALGVNHQSQFVASTISFNLPEGTSLGQATVAIDGALAQLGVPATIRGSFQGTAQAFQASLNSQPWLILAALLTVYIVLGILYESYVHPITILSTLPSAGVGALLALLLFQTEFSVIALIGVILLIGIVKKNAIMMIDFALEAERHRGMSSRDAIFEACLLRFRPIMMTTMAALLAAIPLALGSGDGAELRRPLGISIVGGLIVSQMLTLYTTPVVYLYLDRFSIWTRQLRRRRIPRASPAAAVGD
ncbi:MAG TPA: multidrug efflux RND transporter permease subunit [Casimicrobiaceae bacterium]|jgi:multidrug efflux pump|nr:multidrug efflux RND transporter permease subunit [Casimicrobiaceae bacterium]